MLVSVPHPMSPQMPHHLPPLHPHLPLPKPRPLRKSNSRLFPHAPRHHHLLYPSIPLPVPKIQLSIALFGDTAWRRSGSGGGGGGRSGSRLGCHDNGGDGGGRRRRRCRSGCGGGAGVGVHFQAVDSPVRGLERRRVILHVVLAGSGFGGASCVLGPDATGPVAAEGGVEDDVVVLEVVVYGAAGAADEGRGGIAPGGGVGVRAGGAGGDRVSREEPNVDGGAGPFHGVDATVGRVETVAEGGGAALLDAAALVALAAGTDHGATGVGVHGHGVVGLIVDAFDDVDLTVVGPAGAYG